MFMENLEENIKAEIPLRTGNISRSGPTGTYSVTDGVVSLTVTSDDQWLRLSKALKAPELLEDPRFSNYHNRNMNVEEARLEIQNLIGGLDLAQALKQLEDADVPCAPVRTAAEVMEDRHFWERGSLGPLRHSAMEQAVDGVASGFPVVFSGGPLPKLPGAPTLGLHNSDVYGRLLGLTTEAIESLQNQGVV